MVKKMAFESLQSRWLVLVAGVLLFMGACEGETKWFYVDGFGPGGGGADSGVDATQPDATDRDADAGRTTLEGPVKIGLITPLTYASTFRTAANLAVSEFNSLGGVRGANVELVVGSETASGLTLEEFQKLVDEGVVGIVGPFDTTNAVLVNEIARFNAVPYFSHLGGYAVPFAKQQDVWGFATTAPLTNVVEVGFEHLSGQETCTTYGAVFAARAGTENPADMFALAQASAEKLGGTWVGGVVGPSESDNGLAQFEEAFGENPPDCMYVETVVGGTVLTSMADATDDADIKLIFSTVLFPQLLEFWGVPFDAAADTYALLRWDFDFERYSRFAERFEEELGITLTDDNADSAAIIYETTMSFLLAVESVGKTDGLSVRDAFIEVTADDPGDLQLNLDNISDGIAHVKQGGSVNVDLIWNPAEYEGKGVPSEFIYGIRYTPGPGLEGFENLEPRLTLRYE